MVRKDRSPSLHPRNKYQGRYDFDQLTKKHPTIVKFLKDNKYTHEKTIDFSNPEAVKELNRALLKSYYDLHYWDLPNGFLCPPIPGRADYIHHLKDLLGNSNSVRGLDIGVGANCIYPLLGFYEYQWHFVGAELDVLAAESADKIIKENRLEDYIEIRSQKNHKSIFKGIIQPDEYYHFSMCNPPFHASQKEAELSMLTKTRNLKIKTQLNFGGKSNELWCKGGELEFIKQMIIESVDYKNQVGWFTTLVSKKDNLSSIYGELKKNNIVNVKTVLMGQGQKISRFVAWSFH